MGQKFVAADRLNPPVHGPAAECDHDWQETGGASDLDHIERFERCTRCLEQRAIETPRNLLVKSGEHDVTDAHGGRQGGG